MPRGKRMYTIEHFDKHKMGHVRFDIVIHAGEIVEPINRCVLEVTAVGRPTAMYIPIVLIG